MQEVSIGSEDSLAHQSILHSRKQQIGWGRAAPAEQVRGSDSAWEAAVAVWQLEWQTQGLSFCLGNVDWRLGLLCWFVLIDLQTGMHFEKHL